MMISPGLARRKIQRFIFTALLFGIFLGISYLPISAAEIPVGLIAAGDSLWIIEPSRPEILPPRPAYPIDAEVRDIAAQTLVRHPDYFRDVRVGIATDKGLMLWTPKSDAPVWQSQDDVLCVEANDSAWIVVTRKNGKAVPPVSHLRYAKSSRLNEMLLDETWVTAGEFEGESPRLYMGMVEGTWLREVGPNVMAWKDLTKNHAVMAALVTNLNGNDIYLHTTSPFEGSLLSVLTSNTNPAEDGVVDRSIAIFMKQSLGILEQVKPLNPTIQILGFHDLGKDLWKQVVIPQILDCAEAGPQGRVYYWLLASEDRLNIVQIPTPRTWRKKEPNAEIIATRKLPGEFSALCTNGNSWAAIASWVDDSYTIIEIFDPLDEGMTILSSNIVWGKVKALELVHNDATLTVEEYSIRD